MPADATGNVRKLEGGANGPTRVGGRRREKKAVQRKKTD